MDLGGSPGKTLNSDAMSSTANILPAAVIVYPSGLLRSPLRLNPLSNLINGDSEAMGVTLVASIASVRLSGLALNTLETTMPARFVAVWKAIYADLLCPSPRFTTWSEIIALAN